MWHAAYYEEAPHHKPRYSLCAMTSHHHQHESIIIFLFDTQKSSVRPLFASTYPKHMGVWKGYGWNLHFRSSYVPTYRQDTS